ncbi:MAG TPA: dihydrolipoyllysine-residue acetyltransferase [Ignavibacteriaceae bacterium]|nr:dihydrolipoyllysine-residue acetyltransferase [Ignavibacteriaceae bacterium]
MSKEFKLPELGENIESADVINVLVKTGDKIEKEQGVIEIETDKATVEVPSSVEGTIAEVLVKAGDKIKVGQVLIKVDDNGKEEENKKEEVKKPDSKANDEKPEEKKKEKVRDEKKEEVKKSPEEKPKSKGEKSIVEMKLPELGENIESASIIGVLVKPGDQVEKDQGIIEIETDKATVEVPSNVSGKILEVLVKEGTKAKVGDVLIKVETTEEKATEEVSAKKEEKKEDVKEEKKKDKEFSESKQEDKKEIVSLEKDDQPPIKKGAAPAAPSVRRLARELGVNVDDIPGSGPSGRISLEDVKGFVKQLNEGRSGLVGGGVKKEELPDFSKFGKIERKPMNNIRQKTAQHLSYAWMTIPHVTQFDKADITELEKVRKELNQKAKDNNDKLTMTAILAKVSASALKVFPQFNTSVDMQKNEIVYKKYFHIGIAVDTEFGLIVPVIKNADLKNMTELARDINTLAEKARNKKASLDDLQGACFTITNLGGIGGTYFTPIVNSPETAILGVSRGSYEPFYNGEEFEPRLMLPLSLSYDHRVIDGAAAARFLRWVCEVIENPMKLLVEG